MSVDQRYATIAAVLDNPINRAIVERELIRRTTLTNRGLIPPPVPRQGGGLVFLTMREFQQRPKESVPNGEELDYLAEIFEGSDGWWVVLSDETEAGPYPALTVAHKTAKGLLLDEGYEILDEAPWTTTQVKAYPILPTLS